jgi:hypothetical protein
MGIVYSLNMIVKQYPTIFLHNDEKRFGVYATREIPFGSVIEKCPCAIGHPCVFKNKLSDHAYPTRYSDQEIKDIGEDRRGCLPFGHCGLINYSTEPDNYNAGYVFDSITSELIIVAIENIKENEEITLSPILNEWRKKLEKYNNNDDGDNDDGDNDDDGTHQL